MIVSSSFARDKQPQADGRYWVTWTFTDQLGLQHISQGLCAPDYDPNVDLAVIAQIVETSLENAEIAQAINVMTAAIQPPPMPLTTVDQTIAAKLQYATPQQLAAAVSPKAQQVSLG
jgi:hypothetical protein